MLYVPHIKFCIHDHPIVKRRKEREGKDFETQTNHFRLIRFCVALNQCILSRIILHTKFNKSRFAWIKEKLLLINHGREYRVQL